MKMKPKEISNSVLGIGKVMEAEEKYFTETSKPKFTPKVAIAIARNKRVLDEEFKIIYEIQSQNEKIAEKQKVKIENLKEQKDFLDTELEVQIEKVSQSDLDDCNDLTSADYYALMFMVE